MTLDALVVGAGVSGLTAAAELGRWCRSVTVVDVRSRAHRHRAGEHVPPAGLRELCAAGLADVLADPAHEVSHGVRSAWGGGPPVDKEYFLALPGRGANLRRDVFDEALSRRAEGAGAVLRYGTRLRGVALDTSGYHAEMTCSDGTEMLRADLVVDATGRRATASGFLGARPRRYDELVGIIGRIEGTRAGEEDGRVQVESTEDGWWYAVRFSDGTTVAAFMTDATQLVAGGARDLWEARMVRSNLVRTLAEGGEWTGRVDVFDAATQFLMDDLPPGFVAVGDAAAAWDPLSSWGITKAVIDGRAGADALAREYGGEAGAIAAHRAAQWCDFEAHRARQLEFYGSETRWPAAPFWRARQGTRRRLAS